MALGLLYTQGVAEASGITPRCWGGGRSDRRSGLPASPEGIGISRREFLEAIRHAPATRPDRYTVLSMPDASLPLERATMTPSHPLVKLARCLPWGTPSIR